MKNSKFNERNNVIGLSLKKYRLQMNVSQEELCSRLALIGITLYKNDIYRIESNKRVVKDFELWGISKVLNISYEDLFDLK